MKTLEVEGEHKLVKPVPQAPWPKRPTEVPQPGKTPEAEPSKEPEPGAWPRKNPETQPGKEPLTAPPPAPREIPDRPESTGGKTDLKERPTRKEIKARCKGYMDAIVDSFRLHDNTSTSAVHELRVNLKRVDALLRLIQSGGRKIPSRKLKAFRSFFRLTGKLRSAQVEFELISQYFSEPSFNPTYLHQLHENKARRINKYLAFVEEGDHRSLKKTFKRISESVKGITPKQIRRYLQVEAKKITKRLRRKIFREQDLHSTRKGLKRYYLNLTLAEQQNKPMKGLLDLLGVWHDTQVAFDHLIKAIHTAGLTEVENEPIQKIKTALITDKENLYENIVACYLSHANAGDKDSPVLMSHYS